jgi:hypothetical protein
MDDMRKLGMKYGGLLPRICRHRRLYNNPRLIGRCSATDGDGDDDDDDDDTSTPPKPPWGAQGHLDSGRSFCTFSIYVCTFQTSILNL